MKARALFYNLVDNSLRHGEKVSRIKIYYKEDETDKDKLKLVYEDNGIGISDDTRQNLFKEGYGKGTGYGLYLTAKLRKCTVGKSRKQANMEKEPNSP